MKPFTSKHCTPIFYGSPLNQKDDKKKKEKKDDTFKYLKGFVSSAERSKKDNTKTSTEDFYKRKRELEAKNSPLDIRRSMEAKVVASKQKANKERARKAGNLGRKTTRCASGKPCKGGGH